MRNSNKVKKTTIGLVTGALAIGMFFTPKVKANGYDINKLIKNEVLNVANETPEIEKKALKEINNLRYYSAEKKVEYSRKIRGKSQQEIDTILAEAKNEYLKEISEKAKNECKILEDFLAEVKKYPELDKDNKEYSQQRAIWHESSEKVSQDNINVYKKLIESKVDTSKIKELENLYDQFFYYKIHSQIEIMSRKIGIFRKNYPNNAEIDKIFKDKLMQTSTSTYATLEGIELEKYFNEDFKPYFLQIQEIIRLEESKVEFAKLIQQAKDKKNVENYNKKDKEKREKFESAISNAETKLSNKQITIDELEKEINILMKAIEEIDKAKNTPETIPAHKLTPAKKIQPEKPSKPIEVIPALKLKPANKKQIEKPSNPEDKKEEQPSKPLVPSHKKEEQDAKPLVPSHKKEEQQAKPLVPSHKKEEQPAAKLIPSHKKVEDKKTTEIVKKDKQNKKMDAKKVNKNKITKNPKTGDAGIFLASSTLLISLGTLVFTKKKENK